MPIHYLRFLFCLLFLAPVLVSCTSTGDIENLESLASTSNPLPLPPAVLPHPPSSLSYSPTTVVGYKGVAISAITPTVTGTVTTYSVNPALPAGLTLNSATGVISGTASVAVASAVYTITATNGDGSTTGSIRIGLGPFFVVNSTGNGGDTVLADGVCKDDTGNCTLRAAIQEANAINLPALINVPNGTINLFGSEISVATDLTLVGQSQAGVVLSGGNVSRIFNSTASNFSLSKLTIQNGNAGATGTSEGGGLKHVKSESHLTLDQVSILNNTTASTLHGGGGVYYDGGSTGVLTITNSNISNNSDTAGGGGGSFVGGGGLDIRYVGSGSISGSTFSNNTTAFDGGAIQIQTVWNNDQFSISDTTFSGNSSTGAFDGGGAISSNEGINMYRNLFKNNSAVGGPGGAVSFSQGGTEKIENCTFFGNTASNGFSGHGGAIYIGWTPWDAPSYTNNTIIGNSAGAGGGGIYCATCSSGVNIINTILWSNTGGNCAVQSGLGIISLGYNIDSANTCGFAATGDNINTNPMVVDGPPVNNGGPTYSIEIQSGSPAKNAGSPTVCPATDQRGMTRPSGGVCDIGAYEIQPATM